METRYISGTGIIPVFQKYSNYLPLSIIFVEICFNFHNKICNDYFN